MSVATAAIRTAIVDLLEGRAGSIRVMAPRALGYASFDGQSQNTQEAQLKTLDVGSVFDLRLLSIRPHGATPQSITASYRTALMPIEILLWTKLRKYERDKIRDQQRDEIQSAGDDIIQAITYPGNLTQTADGVATGIVSGMLLGQDGKHVPSWEVIEENWTTRLLHSVIRASAILEIAQPTA